MKRFLPLLVLAAATILLAQSPNQVTLRTPTGDRTISMTQANGQTLFPADEILAALGGAVAPAVVDGRPYTPLQFFQGYLAKAADLETSWDPVARVLSIVPTQHTIIG